MYIEKYTLIIPFKLNNNSTISIKDSSLFQLEKYTVELKLDELHKGHFKIHYFYNSEDILPFYNNFKKIIALLNLDAGLWSIKIKELNTGNINDYIKVNYEIDKRKINRNCIYFIPETTTILPCTLKAIPIFGKSFIKMSDEIKFYYSKIDLLDLNENKKLKTALNLYSDSYFKDFESRFLIYMTILELLKPSIKRKGVGKKCAEQIKNVVAKFRECDEVKYDEELKNEMNEIDGSLNHIADRSIKYSLKQLAKENNIKIKGYEITEMINSYKVRNEYVHRGKIRKEFDECLNFLTKFIPKILKVKIDEMIED